VPRAESIETRKKMWEESRKPNTEKNLRTAIQRWNEFVATGSGDGQPYDDVEIERFLNDDGTIRPQVATTGTAFANYLYERNGMTFPIYQNCMNYLKSKLEYQLFVISLPYPEGYIRGISRVKAIETTLRKQKQDVKKKRPDGTYEFCDIASKLDNQIEVEQMLKGAERLLDNDLEGMSERVALQTLYEFAMSHVAATRSECFRSDKMALCFTREIHAIGPEGTTVFCWYNNGGKENEKGRIEYYVAANNMNGSLDPSAARGLMLMYRFTAEYGCGEEPPDFLKPDEIFLCPVVRGFQNRCVQALAFIFIYFTCTHYTLHTKSSTSMCYYYCYCYMCIIYFTGRKAATMKTKTMMTSPLLSQKLRIEINTKT